MTDLPPSWASAQLSDLGPWIGGGTPSKANPAYWNGPIPWVSPKDMKTQVIRETVDGITAEAIERSSAKRVPPKSVLIVTRSGILAHSLPVAVTAIESSLNQDLKALSPPRGIDPNYIAWGLKACEHRILDTCRKGGTTVQSIEMPSLSRFELPVAPTNEQHRIVDRIETLFDEIDRGVESLRTAKNKIDLYRQSLLKSAFEGRLTADWRTENSDKLEHPHMLLARIREEREKRYQQQLAEWKVASTDWSENKERDRKPKKPLKPKHPPPLSAKDLNRLTPLPDTWRWIRVADIGLVGTGVTPLRSKHSYYEDGDVGWVTSGALNNPVVKVPTRYVTTTALNDTNLRIYPSQTLLIALYGEGKTRGKCSELLIPAATNQAIAAIVQEATSADFRKFLKWFFTKNYEEIRSGSSGGVQPNLNLGIIENTPIPLCSTLEAKEIVKRVEAKISQIEAAEEEIETCLHRSNALRQSILKQAFSGKLVPQDPDDEPASVLVARIRAERDTKPPKRSRRRAQA